LRAAWALVAVAGLSGGCGSRQDHTVRFDSAAPQCRADTVGAGAGAAIDLFVSEWSIDAIGTLDRGRVLLRAHNDTDRRHRLALVRLERDAGLPVTAESVLDTAKLPRDRFVAEVPVGVGGDVCVSEVAVEPGDYALFCVVEDASLGPLARHWSNGLVRWFSAA
jgi:hypothetical protein